jgi:two-component system CheB/CheR fusion protein
MALAAQQLREPLALILNASDNLAPSDASAQLSKGIYQLLRCINNMSDTALYQQLTEPPTQIRDVDALFREICQKSAALVEAAGIHMTYQGLENPIFSAVEPERLERALYNLISNASKFTEAGGTISVSLTRHGSMFVLCVEDTGCGMDAHKLQSAFRQYLRQPGLEDGRKGIGLGLALVLAAAAAHEGTVLLQTPPSGGMKVTMTLKIRPKTATTRSPILTVDYAGERDHSLMELAEILPSHIFK